MFSPIENVAFNDNNNNNNNNNYNDNWNNGYESNMLCNAKLESMSPERNSASMETHDNELVLLSSSPELPESAMNGDENMDSDATKIRKPLFYSTPEGLIFVKHLEELEAHITPPLLKLPKTTLYTGFLLNSDHTYVAFCVYGIVLSLDNDQSVSIMLALIGSLVHHTFRASHVTSNLAYISCYSARIANVVDIPLMDFEKQLAAIYWNRSYNDAPFHWQLAIRLTLEQVEPFLSLSPVQTINDTLVDSIVQSWHGLDDALFRPLGRINHDTVRRWNAKDMGRSYPIANSIAQWLAKWLIDCTFDPNLCTHFTIAWPTAVLLGPQLSHDVYNALSHYRSATKHGQCTSGLPSLIKYKNVLEEFVTKDIVMSLVPRQRLTTMARQTLIDCCIDQCEQHFEVGLRFK